MHFDIRKTAGLDSILSLREQYLDGLAYTQELYLEMRVRRGDVWLADTGGNRPGYLICDENHTLLEYHWPGIPEDRYREYLRLSLKKLNIRRILCKSFDQRFLIACREMGGYEKTIGVLFRGYNPVSELVFDQSPQVQPAQAGDKDILWDLNEGVWENREEVAEFVEKGHVFIYRSNNTLIGFGIFSPVIRGRPGYDIGMLVAPAYRRRGWGARIVKHLASHCVKHDWIPVCGCDIRNNASRNCLKKAGFKDNHRLYSFDLGTLVGEPSNR